MTKILAKFHLVFGPADNPTPVVNGSFFTREQAEDAIAERKFGGTGFPNEWIFEGEAPAPKKSEYRVDQPATKHLPGALYAAYLLASTSAMKRAAVYRVDLSTGDQFFYADADIDIDSRVKGGSLSFIAVTQRLPRGTTKKAQFREVNRIAIVTAGR